MHSKTSKNGKNSKNFKNKGPGGKPLPHANSKTPGQFEKLSKNSKGPDVKGVQKPTEAKESFQTNKKNLINDINTFNMSKSLFDKLFEDVMSGGVDDSQLDTTGDYSDEQELGIDTGSDDMGGDMGGDEVTITLDKETAQKFYDALGAILGGGMGEDEDMGDDDLDMGDEEFEGEEGEDEDGEDENPFGEGVDIEELGAESKAKTFQNKNNKVSVSSQYSPKSGKAHIGKIPATDTGSAFTKKTNLHDKGQHKVSANFSDSAFNGGSK
jgi:hypothetical protein